MECGDDADPAVGQGILRRHHLVQLQDRSLAPRLDREEQDDDGQIGDRRDHEVDVQRHQHTAVVQRGKSHDDDGDDALVVPVSETLTGVGLHRVGDEDGVGHLEHCVGEHEVERHVEGHQRADDVLGLGILTTGRGNRRGHLGIDHGDGGVEKADHPADDQRGECAALVSGEVPASVFADQNDADTQSPDMAGAEDAQQ